MELECVDLGRINIEVKQIRESREKLVEKWVGNLPGGGVLSVMMGSYA
jgi:hypothetical protein